jgi:4-hydroxy-2-oxoheptanedioate aldolase
MLDMVRNFREKLKNGEAVFGPFSKTMDPAFVEASGYSGFDFIILDMEHGPSDVLLLQNLIRAAEVARIIPIVRVPMETITDIGRVLDIGAGGVQIPQITTAKQAKEVLEVSKFAPYGQRGVCRFVRAAKYSTMDRFQYFKDANDALVILQLEGSEAIENLDEILEVSGIDIIFVGPYDLSQSLGVPGQVEHELVISKIQEINEKCKAKGIAVGVFTDNVRTLERWKSAGVQYLSYSVDVGLYAEYCRSLVEQYKAI